MKPEDFAQKIELAEWEERQKSGRLPKSTVASATHCRDPHCGEPIPEERRKAWVGVQFCVECQKLNEKKG